MSYKTITPNEVSTAVLHSYMLGAVAPRPIAFVSTMDKEGKVNLSPFSFFNIFGSNPPIMIFSPARRVRDNTNKHTLENVHEVKEVTVNIVNYAMVEQTSLASTEYEKGVNEFTKAGFTEEPSTLVKPPRVKESPVSFECKVREVIATGNEGGAGNLIVCEILMMHIRENILDEKGQIDPQKLDAVARMGGDWYCRASGAAVFEVAKPNQKKGIGVDAIPESIRWSPILTGNHLGRLGNIEALPSAQEIADFAKNEEIQSIFEDFQHDKKNLELNLHQIAKRYLDLGDVKTAWCCLLQSSY